jgi:hypothetical protein
VPGPLVKGGHLGGHCGSATIVAEDNIKRLARIILRQAGLATLGKEVVAGQVKH